jgi:hypothetical protein
MGLKLHSRLIWALIGGVVLTVTDRALRPHLQPMEVAELFAIRTVTFFVIYIVMPYFTKRPEP